MATRLYVSKLVSNQVVCRNPNAESLDLPDRGIVANDRNVARLTFIIVVLIYKCLEMVCEHIISSTALKFGTGHTAT